MNEHRIRFNGSFYSADISENEWETFIDEESGYYIKKWKSTESPGEDASWNWGAFFGGVIWMGYRKMYKEVLVFFLILLPIAFMDCYHKTDIFAKLAGNIAAIILGVYGNCIYFNYARRKIQSIKALGNNENTEMLLKKSGGISVLGICFVLVMICVFVFAEIQMPNLLTSK